MACIIVEVENGEEIALLNFFGEEDAAERLFMADNVHSGRSCVIGALSMDDAMEMLEDAFPDESFTVREVPSECCAVVVTYETVTEESAEMGDSDDHDFMSLSDHADPANSARMSVKREDDVVGEEIVTTPEHMRGIAMNFNVDHPADDSCRWLSSYGDVDFATGERTQYALHVNGLVHLGRVAARPESILRALDSVLNERQAMPQALPACS